VRVSHTPPRDIRSRCIHPGECVAHCDALLAAHRDAGALNFTYGSIHALKPEAGRDAVMTAVSSMARLSISIASGVTATTFQGCAEKLCSCDTFQDGFAFSLFNPP
jgi:hypothetical protein